MFKYISDKQRGSPLLFIYILSAYLPCLVSYYMTEFRSTPNDKDKCNTANVSDTITDQNPTVIHQ